MKNLVNRFLKYVSFNTQSNPAKSCCPSSAGQMTFAEYLRDELTELGLRQVSLDEHGYVMAKLPSNVDFAVPAIGFIAHMDTAPDASGRNIAPQFIEEYQGGDIALGKGDEVLSPIRYPELHQLHGHNLITTDGRTLLGADDKAGIAEIVTAIEELIQHPEIAHGDICIGFTPDEEIGRGANLFDVERFGAQWAYTVDGGPLGELEYENFNAANAEVIIYGNNVHPGWAKDKMVNAMNIAARFQMMMPQAETPEQTEGYQGFYHLKSAKMSVAKSQLSYILRDFEREGLEARKAYMRQLVDTLNAQLHHGRVELQMKDCYYNMREMIEPHPHIVELAKQAMMECDVEPVIKPIRGGTDGARLSFMGLPCPNLFTGGYNFHGIHEFVSVEAMEQAVKVILRLSEKTAQYHRE